jgi:hypothetical protein
MSQGWEWDVRGGTILRLRRHPAPNKALHLTAYSLRSFLASASGGR